jgi:type II pantothenate kinase
VSSGEAVSGVAIGIDSGASLVKLAVQNGRDVQHRLLPASAWADVTATVAELAPERIGVTGGGARGLVERIARDCHLASEFDAWGAGAHALLRAQGAQVAAPYLLVSVGTGTSVMRVDGAEVVRVGGTALGGGSVLGLAALLLGEHEFEEIVALAAKGDRRNVDLLISEIYRDFPGDFTASNFGKPALRNGSTPKREDLAAAILGLVAENVGLIAASLAAAHPVKQIVFGGSTLRGNPAMRDVAGLMARMRGYEPVFLERCEYAGAVGALHLALASEG